jgi:hypothetical protein
MRISHGAGAGASCSASRISTSPAAGPEYEQAVYDDLAWLGSPGSGRCGASRSISTTYRAAFRAPEGEGARLSLLSAAAATSPGRSPGRSGPAPGRATRTAPPLYPGTCRDLRPVDAAARIARGEPHAWRLPMARPCGRPRAPGPTAASIADGASEPAPRTPSRWGDAVLVRKETPTSYHLSVVVDDALQGVTHVVRGHGPGGRDGPPRPAAGLLGLPTPALPPPSAAPGSGGRQALEERPLGIAGGPARAAASPPRRSEGGSASSPEGSGRGRCRLSLSPPPRAPAATP